MKALGLNVLFLNLLVGLAPTILSSNLRSFKNLLFFSSSKISVFNLSYSASEILGLSKL